VGRVGRQAVEVSLGHDPAVVEDAEAVRIGLGEEGLEVDAALAERQS
jgi:hypothetical protein